MTIPFLLDTGVSRSIISTNTFQTLSTKDRNKMKKEEIPKLHLQLADGTPLKINSCASTRIPYSRDMGQMVYNYITVVKGVRVIDY